MQDALLDSIKSLSIWCMAARQEQQEPNDVVAPDLLEQANVLTLKATFSTLTNVNFSSSRIADYIRQVEDVKVQVRDAVLAASPGDSNSSSVTEQDYGALASLDLRHMDDTYLEEYGHSFSGLAVRSAVMNHPDAFSLNEVGTYGLKGACAYATHVYQLVGKTDPTIMAAIHEIFAKLARPQADMDGLLANALRVGEVNGQILAALDAAHAEQLGIPEPTPVRTSAVAGKAILVSGHDLNDLHHLLQQTAGTGVNVYTHG